MKLGWTELEKDSLGRTLTYGRAYTLTHSKKVQVFTRQCSHNHPECEIRYSGREHGWHRQTHDTMIKHEVILLYWYILLKMKGPGVESYVGVIQKLYDLSKPPTTVSAVGGSNSLDLGVGGGGGGNRLDSGVGGAAEAHGFEESAMFRKGDVIRACVFGYLARQRRTMNTPCPTCKPKFVGGQWVSTCQNVIVDAKRLKIPQSEVYHSPDLVTGETPKVRAAFGQVKERYFLPGDQYKLERQTARAMAAKLMRRSTTSKQAVTKEAIEQLSKNIPCEYKPCIDMMIGLYEKMNLLPNNETNESKTPIPDHDINDADDNDEADDNVYDYDYELRANGCVSVEGLSMIQFEICYQIYSICNKQCEATQWITKWDLPIITHILKSSSTFSNLQLLEWKQSGLRASIFHLIESSVQVISDGEYKLDDKVVSLLSAMVQRVEALLAVVKDKPSRALLDKDKQKPYDPSTGVAYSFSSSGAQMYEWPHWKGVAKSRAKDCDCRKPDWMRTTKAGLSEGVLTFMCLKSNTVIGVTFLTAHEGQKDAAAALYCYKPNLEDLVSVVCDTPCMHASYLMTRAPRDFVGVKFTADRFHGKKHTCFEIYDADEYDLYRHVNTSLIEQHHAIIDCLTTTFKSTTLSHAMFLLQTLHQDIYDMKCKDLGATDADMCWPTSAP
jgi:hypothetical protein